MRSGRRCIPIPNILILPWKEWRDESLSLIFWSCSVFNSKKRVKRCIPISNILMRITSMKRVKRCIPILNIPILISLQFQEKNEEMQPLSLITICLVFTSEKIVKSCIPIPFTIILSCLAFTPMIRVRRCARILNIPILLYNLHSHEKSEEMHPIPKIPILLSFFTSMTWVTVRWVCREGFLFLPCNN